MLTGGKGSVRYAELNLSSLTLAVRTFIVFVGEAFLLNQFVMQRHSYILYLIH